jgi:hypothetical protein
MTNAQYEKERSLKSSLRRKRKRFEVFFKTMTTAQYEKERGLKKKEV